jgi:RNA polymerase sigma-70 factor (ECF subfamily)
VQDVFIALWKTAGRFDPEVASETTFVAMIARRRLIDRARASGRQTRPEVLNESAPAVDRPRAIEVGEEAALASSVIETLSAEQQRVLRLSIYQGLSHEQVAQATGLPLGTVKTHIRRGLIRVRDVLEAERGIVK